MWYLRTFHKTVEKIQISSIYCRNNWYFTWRPIHICGHISLSYSYNGKFFRQNCTENGSTHFRFRNFFTKNRSVYEIMWKNVLWSWEDHRWQYGACALYSGYLRLQTHTLNMKHLLLFQCNNTRPRLTVTLSVQYIACLVFWLQCSELRCCQCDTVSVYMGRRHTVAVQWAALLSVWHCQCLHGPETHSCC